MLRAGRLTSIAEIIPGQMSAYGKIDQPDPVGLYGPQAENSEQLQG
jgi:hypothetical protein